MKIITHLPNWKIHFRPIESESKWGYVWEHKGSTRLRVYSQVANPWGKTCVINVKTQKFKNDIIKYTTRVDLQILSLDDIEHAIEADLVLEKPFPGIPHSMEPTLRFYAIPCENKNVQLNIILSIVAKK